MKGTEMVLVMYSERMMAMVIAMKTETGAETKTEMHMTNDYKIGI